jgi:hypothetical protein
VIWYEWLDEAWAVLISNIFVEFGSWFKFLDVFMGQKDPIKFDIWAMILFVVCLVRWGRLIVLLG